MISDISRPLTNQHPLFSLFTVKKWNSALIGQSGAHELLPRNHLEMTRTGFIKLNFSPIFNDVLHRTLRTTERYCSWKRISHYKLESDTLSTQKVGSLLFSTFNSVSRWNYKNNKKPLLIVEASLRYFDFNERSYTINM